ncbi:multi-sensor signal transduction histidine kinase [Oscillochloris trichoides DG-6]|uniref:histidine kinase n=1 Tax=Oscillochloris trichoides DG-6 TaxID=765420 RepID=E1IGL6_9CHLR|nr:multi-sensor signal transduction histidine kinase [Oscillochloris trichoides DG-6]
MTLEHSSNDPSLDMRTTALLRIASVIETAATLDELLLLAQVECVQLLDIPFSGVLFVSEDGMRVRLVNAHPPRVNLPPAILLTEAPLLIEVISERRVVQLADLHATPLVEVGSDAARLLRQLLDQEHLCSLLLLPLIAQDHVIGLIIFATIDQQRHFSERDMALARLMTGQLAAAITSFRTTEQAERRTSELATLNEISAAVTSSLNARDIYHLVMEKLNEYFQVDAGSLLMIDPETHELVFVMTLEAGEEKLFGVRVPQGQGIVGMVAQTQRYAIIHNAQQDPRFYAKVSESVNYVVHTILCVPIIVKARTIGVIELLNKRDGVFTEQEADRLMRMAATIGVALENAHLFQEVTTVRDRFEAILNSTNDGILMADMHGMVVTTNPMAAQLFGCGKESLIGRPISELLAELKARAIAVSSPSWLNEQNGSDQVVEVELSAGRFVRHYTLPVREANGAEIGRLALFQDISKERELAQLREDYTGMLVHDLRAPLTAIMNGIMMVKRGMGGPVSEQQHELLAIAHQGSQAMLEMVNTLLDISKMEQGHMALDVELISPYALVDQPLDRLVASARNHHVALEQHLEADLPLIEADRDKLVRVLQNLLDNAIKFSPTGTTVTLGGAALTVGDEVWNHPHVLPIPLEVPPLRSGTWLIFWVRDQGPGIPVQYHERIFEKFGQVRGRKVRGTGLGLTFCKLAIESHGGKIWLQSAEGAGSIFAFALPVAAHLASQA